MTRLLFVLCLLQGSLLAADEIRIALRPVLPYVAVAPSGVYSGLEYNIIQEALAVRGHTLRPVIMPLARLVETFRSGGVEAAAPILARHRAGGTLSEPYLIYHNVALALAESRIDLRSLADLRGLTIAAFQTATSVLGEAFLDVVTGNPKYREEAQQVTQIRLLFSRRVQVAVGDSRILHSYIRAPETGVDATIPTVEFPIFPPTPYSVAFRDPKLAYDFNAGLAAIKADGRYAKLLARYP